MPLILLIETATEICSVALAQNGKLISIQEEKSPNSHSSVITLLIEKLFDESKLSMNQLDAVAVSAGPGSFTGLRIGVSVAKGICYSLGKPLIAISTLQPMAAGAVEQVKDKNALYCPVMDSIKQEVYAGLYDSNLDEIIAATPAETNLAEFLPRFGEKKVYFFGSGTKKLSGLSYDKAEAVNDFSNSAKHMIELSEKYFSEKKFASIEYFEPDYVKGFVTREKYLAKQFFSSILPASPANQA